MKLVLIRHGESEWNKENKFTGWTDVELSEAGVEEAKKAGKVLKETGYDFDICYTSYLKRAIHTLNNVLAEMDREWLPVVKSWRRSFDIPPMALTEDDERNPKKDPKYREEDPAELPLQESLKDTITRAVPYFEEEIKPQIKSGRRVVIAAHGNSLRALVKYFDGLSDEEIINVNIPTATPLVYEFDDEFNVIGKEYLCDPDELAAKMNSVANQGKAK